MQIDDTFNPDVKKNEEVDVEEEAMTTAISAYVRTRGRR